METEKELAILAGVGFQKDVFSIEDSIEELAQLAKTAGADVVATLTQKRDTPDLEFYLGRGKVDELIALIKEKNANLVIMDNDLKPSQKRNLEEAVGIKVIDRPELIMDIFALHAHTQEGRLQVALAQAAYQLTQQSGKGVTMSRLGGGIGTRGPGETKLEESKRDIRHIVSELKKQLENVRKARGTRRDLRKNSGIKTASIVGYTNAGKSTLINSLTKSDVLAENKLFATLDTTTRRLYLENGETILVSDTIGFIQKLPHQLIDAFKATLEEVTDSDILIHVVDLSSKHIEHQINTVYTVLEEINAIAKPMITVFNKMDLIPNGSIVEPHCNAALLKKCSPYVIVSALKKDGMAELKKAIFDKLSAI